MLRILYLGKDKISYNRMKDGLPINMSFRPVLYTDCIDKFILKHDPHALVYHLSSPNAEDLCRLRRVLNHPAVPGVVVTAERITPAQAVSCMKLGAYDCLTGPVNGEILSESLLSMFRRHEINTTLIKGNSPPVKKLRSLLKDFGSSDYPVLITGETGSGKELAARTIHECSRRCRKPFRPVNCATYSDDLICSELFGSVQGAFTGSVNKPGLFEECRGGTVFLDEIGELSLHGQASILRALEEGKVRRVGSSRETDIDIRIITATNRNLRSYAAAGKFREDLYYRLDVLGVAIPPLRKRKEDLECLSLAILNEHKAHPAWQISSGAMALMAKYSWPGNVRELKSAIIKASLKARHQVIRPYDLSLGRHDCRGLITAEPEIRSFQR